MKEKFNINNRRKQLGLTLEDVGKACNVSKSTVMKWETGFIENMKRDKVALLAKVLQVSPLEIMGAEYSSEPSTFIQTAIKIPVLGNVQAGIPIEAIQEILDYEEISESMAKQGDYFGLVVRGRSMEPKFSHGDVVIVRKQSTADTGDIVIALVNGDDATIKKLKRTENGIMLVPTNPEFEAMFYTNEEIESTPVRIIGKVVELRAKF